ncbi:unnamed protein product [Acanthocheilonema viteae]|uniref:SUEL-type lectin domain-containing protein n=1 Tax=Acanthocheilonema viteae TaxID=6277 RepID=A0A498SSB2_ACAVI|nr:unnamed protein product [Acanthocheilonema viteae]
MQLSCKQNRRLVIYSAHYGRAVEGRAMHCTSNASIAQDCMINVLDQVLYNCHARTECTALVNDEQFGKTGCGPGIHKYLTVIFMCMNDEIFSEAAVKGNLEAMNKIISHLSPMKIPEVKTTLVKDDELNFHIKDDPNLGCYMLNSLLVNSYEESEDDGAFVIANPIDVTTPSGLPFNVFGFIHDVLVIVQIIKGLIDHIDL